MTKKAKTYKKKLEENKLGYRTSDHFKGKTFKPSNKQGYNPSRFKVQHKG